MLFGFYEAKYFKPLFVNGHSGFRIHVVPISVFFEIRISYMQVFAYCLPLNQLTIYLSGKDGPSFHIEGPP